MQEEIIEYTQFGEVTSVKVREFKTAEAASAVLSNQIHRIADIDTKGEVAELWNQPDQILNALNDDCLRQVFKFFDEYDLLNAADVCVRFKERAKEEFGRKYKNIHGKEVSTIELMMQKFGSSIQSLKISSYWLRNDRKTLKMINEHTRATLKSLKLVYFEFLVDMNFHSTFKSLKKLHLDNCEITNLNDLLAKCPELKVLKLQMTQWNGEFLNQRFAKLEELELSLNNPLNDLEFNRFIGLNPTITKLKVTKNNSVRSVAAVRVIGQHLPNLMELDIYQEFENMHEFQESAQTLGCLKSLKSLALNFNSMSVTPLMVELVTNEVPIEQLTLQNGAINTEAIENITQLKRIKMLRLKKIYGLTNNHIIELARELQQLKELHLMEANEHQITTLLLKNMLRYATKLTYLKMDYTESIDIQIDDFMEMLQAVRQRPDRLKLRIEIRGENITDVPDRILADNTNLLDIDIY